MSESLHQRLEQQLAPVEQFPTPKDQTYPGQLQLVRKALAQSDTPPSLRSLIGEEAFSDYQLSMKEVIELAKETGYLSDDDITVQKEKERIYESITRNHPDEEYQQVVLPYLDATFNKLNAVNFVRDFHEQREENPHLKARALAHRLTPRWPLRKRQIRNTIQPYVDTPQYSFKTKWQEQQQIIELIPRESRKGLLNTSLVAAANGTLGGMVPYTFHLMLAGGSFNPQWLAVRFGAYAANETVEAAAKVTLEGKLTAINKHHNKQAVQRLLYGDLHSAGGLDFGTFHNSLMDGKEALDTYLKEQINSVIPTTLRLGTASMILCLIDYRVGLVNMGVTLLSTAIAHQGNVSLRPSLLASADKKEKATELLRNTHEAQEDLRTQRHLENYGETVVDNLTMSDAIRHKIARKRSLHELAAYIPLYGASAACGWTAYMLNLQPSEIIASLMLGAVATFAGNIVIKSSAEAANTIPKIKKLITLLEDKEFDTEKDQQRRPAASLETTSISMQNLQYLLPKNSSVKGPERMILDIDELSIQDGEFICLTGESGSGKTSLLRIIAGITEQTNPVGKIMIDGVELKDIRQSGSQAYSSILGYSAQKPVFDARLTLMQNLMPGAKLITEADEERARSLLWRLGLRRQTNELHDLLPAKISGGQRKRLGLARALMAEPRLLLLDEPTSELDKKSIPKVHKVLREYYQTTKTTTICVTHDHELTVIGRRIELSDISRQARRKH